MSDTAQPNAEVPPQTPTGEIVDQSKPTEAKPAETKETGSTKDVKESTSSTAEKKDESLLNKKDEKVEGVPEKYEFKLPENFVVTDAQNTAIQKLFKDQGLSQTQAQAMVDHYAQLSQAAANEMKETYIAQRKEWQNAVMADKELGPNLKEIKTDVARMVDGLGDAALAKDFRAAMDLTGAGDHPAFVKLFSRLAKKFGEGKPVTGGVAEVTKPGAAARPSAASALYPNLS